MSVIRRAMMNKREDDPYKDYIIGKALTKSGMIDAPLYGITPYFPMVNERYLKCGAYCEIAYNIEFYDDEYNIVERYVLYGNNVVDGVRTWRGSAAMAEATWCRFTFLLERIDDIYLRRNSPTNTDYIFKGKNV